MRTLILHIGAHKTGTTSLQACLRENSEELLKAGIQYVWGGRVPNLHRNLGFVSKQGLFPHGFCVSNPEQLKLDLASAENEIVIASSENFSFFFEEESISRLQMLLLELFDRVIIFTYLRRQDAHAVSHFQEGSKPNRVAERHLWGHSLGPLPEATENQRLYLDYDVRMRLWEGVFGQDNVIIRPFESDQLKNGSVVSDFFNILGVKGCFSPDTSWKNKSVDKIRAKLGHLANRILRDPDYTSLVLAGCPESGKKMLPSAGQARAFLEPYVSSNIALQKRKNVSVHRELFNSDFSMYPDTATDDLSPSEAEEILQHLMCLIGGGLAHPRTCLHFDDFLAAAVALKTSDPIRSKKFLAAARKLRPGSSEVKSILQDWKKIES